jgi:hypothetical protein
MTVLAAIEDVEAVISQAIPSDAVGFVARQIEMVSARVTKYLPRISFVPVVDDSVLVHPHDGELRLPHQPVTSVTSVTIGSTLVSPTEYEVKSNGYLRRNSPLSVAMYSQWGIAGPGFWPGQWPANGEFGWPPLPTTVVYSHGYTSVPDDISLVVAEITAAKFLGGERQASGTIMLQVDKYREQFYKNEPTGPWLPDHKEILDAYRRGGFASVRLG